MSGSREKIRAVFLAAIMVVSVFGATVAFTGSAAATVDGPSTHYLNAGVDAQDTRDASEARNTFSWTVDRGDLGNTNYLEITASGVTWDTDSDNLLTYGTSDTQVTIDNVEYVDNKTLRVDASGSLSADDQSININGLALNVDSNADASGADVDFQGGSLASLDFFEVKKHTASLSGGAVSTAAGTTATLNDLTVAEPAEIGNISDDQYDLQIALPSDSGFSFSDGGSKSGQNGNFDIDTDPVSVSIRL